MDFVLENDFIYFYFELIFHNVYKKLVMKNWWIYVWCSKLLFHSCHRLQMISICSFFSLILSNRLEVSVFFIIKIFIFITETVNGIFLWISFFYYTIFKARIHNKLHNLNLLVTKCINLFDKKIGIYKFTNRTFTRISQWMVNITRYGNKMFLF